MSKLFSRLKILQDPFLNTVVIVPSVLVLAYANAYLSLLIFLLGLFMWYVQKRCFGKAAERNEVYKNMYLINVLLFSVFIVLIVTNDFIVTLFERNRAAFVGACIGINYCIQILMTAIMSIKPVKESDASL